MVANALLCTLAGNATLMREKIKEGLSVTPKWHFK